MGDKVDERILVVGLIILVTGVISVEIGVSSAILLIIAGFFSRNFINFTSPEWLIFFGNLGFLAIVFNAGFEVDFDYVVKNWYKATVIGVAGFFTPLIFVFIVSYYFLALTYAQAVIVSIALSTTSLSLVYCVLHCKYAQDHTLYQLVISTSAIIDFFTILSLTLFIRPPNIESLIYGSILVIVLLLSPKISKKFLEKYRGKNAEMEIRLIILLLLTLSFITKHVSVGETVVVFALGLFLARVYDKEVEIKEKVRGLIFGFLAPIFFFQAGLLMELSHITEETLFFGVIFGLVAYTGKYVGVYTIVRRLLNTSAAKTLGFLFNVRLAFALIVAIFALEEGIISIQIYTSIILATLLGTLLSSTVLKLTPQETLTTI